MFPDASYFLCFEFVQLSHGQFRVAGLSPQKFVNTCGYPGRASGLLQTLLRFEDSRYSLRLREFDLPESEIRALSDLVDETSMPMLHARASAEVPDDASQHTQMPHSGPDHPSTSSDTDFKAQGDVDATGLTSGDLPMGNDTVAADGAGAAPAGRVASTLRSTRPMPQLVCEDDEDEENDPMSVGVGNSTRRLRMNASQPSCPICTQHCEMLCMDCMHVRRHKTASSDETPGTCDQYHDDPLVIGPSRTEELQKALGLERDLSSGKEADTKPRRSVECVASLAVDDDEHKKFNSAKYDCATIGNIVCSHDIYMLTMITHDNENYSFMMLLMLLAIVLKDLRPAVWCTYTDLFFLFCAPSFIRVYFIWSLQDGLCFMILLFVCVCACVVRMGCQAMTLHVGLDVKQSQSSPS
jgi:hypothetical protein